MTEEEIKEAQAFYDSEYRGLPLNDVITFRCTKTLGNWLRSKGMIEKKDHSAVIRSSGIFENFSSFSFSSLY